MRVIKESFLESCVRVTRLAIVPLSPALRPVGIRCGLGMKVGSSEDEQDVARCHAQVFSEEQLSQKRLLIGGRIRITDLEVVRSGVVAPRRHTHQLVQSANPKRLI